MRIDSMYFKNVDPIKRFEIEGLSDVVVLAGPNGVGKTRFLNLLVAHLQNNNNNTNRSLVKATCEDERKAWNKDTLDTSIDSDHRLLIKTFQDSPRRGHLRNSILNFDSDRSIQQLKPFPWSWDIKDPLEENIGWNVGFGRMRDRYQDVVHSMFRIIEHQKRSIATQAIKLKREGKESMGLHFSDPMEPFKDVFSQLLAPKILADPLPSEGALKFIDNGTHRTLDSLSSGEFEVVKIAFDFLLRRPSDCIVFFDEPELHLHPELSNRLIRTLSRIGARNQFFLCTHSSELITASLDNTVIFVSPPKKLNANDEYNNQAIKVSSEDDTNNAMELLGHSIGIVALGKRIVLIEGYSASLDRQTYGAILQNRFPELVLVPSGSRDTISSFAHIDETILKQMLWGIEFYSLSDGDASVWNKNGAVDPPSKHMHLPRYHLENYFLDAAIIAEAFRQLEPEDSWLRKPKIIEEKLVAIGRESIPYSVALMASCKYRLDVGNVDIMPKNVDHMTCGQLCDEVSNCASRESNRVSVALNDTDIRDYISNTWDRLTQLIESGNSDWKKYIPGKRIVSVFANRSSIQPGRLKTLYISTANKAGKNPFDEIISIFDSFNTLTKTN